MAAAFAMLTKGVVGNICLINARKDAATGEMMDLQHGLSFMGRHVHIHGDSDYATSAGSKVCVITAGARQKEGESRLDLVKTNVGIFKGIVPNIVKYSPNCIILVVSNPVDIMTWVTWKLSGLPRHRIIGSGTSLDTSRFRYLLGEKFGIGGQSIHGYILGEHGDSSVAVWSAVNIAGTRLMDIHPNIGDETGKDPENWHEVSAVYAVNYCVIISPTSPGRCNCAEQANVLCLVWIVAVSLCWEGGGVKPIPVDNIIRVVSPSN